MWYYVVVIGYLVFVATMLNILSDPRGGYRDTSPAGLARSMESSHPGDLDRRKLANALKDVADDAPIGRTLSQVLGVQMPDETESSFASAFPFLSKEECLALACSSRARAARLPDDQQKMPQTFLQKPASLGQESYLMQLCPGGFIAEPVSKTEAWSMWYIYVPSVLLQVGIIFGAAAYVAFKIYKFSETRSLYIMQGAMLASLASPVNYVTLMALRAALAKARTARWEAAEKKPCLS